MPAAKVSFEKVEAKRIGFLADTHCRQPDGSDLPQEAMDAFTGVDLIVHLGDVGQKGVLDRLGAIARVLSPERGKGHVIEAGGVRIGMTFDLSKPGVAVTVDESGVKLPQEPIEEILASKFGERVDVVAFGGTHRQLEQKQAGVLFFNPGSPTLPADRQGPDDLGSVAVLDVSDGMAAVELVRLTKN